MAERQARIYCNYCSNKTWHALRAEYTKRFDPSDYGNDDIAFADGTWQIWQCKGCDEVVFCRFWVTSDDLSDGADKFQPAFEYYPSRFERLLTKKHYLQLPDTLDHIYGEVINTYNCESPLLCAGGLRALVEGLCKDKHAPVGSAPQHNLEHSIDALASVVPANMVKHLHAFRFMGNTALHELEEPSREDLADAIEIIEGILNVLYELDSKAARLYQRYHNSTRSSKLP